MGIDSVLFDGWRLWAWGVQAATDEEGVFFCYMAGGDWLFSGDLRLGSFSDYKYQ